MLFELILELFGDLFLAGAGTVAVGTVAITEIATEGEVVLSTASASASSVVPCSHLSLLF